jgi:MoxR-like ATPase
MANLFWCSAASSSGNGARNLDRSLLQGVPVEELREQGLDLPDTELEVHARDGRVRFWGTRASSANFVKWDRLEPGDVGLIYTGNARFGHWGEVWAKARSRAVAEHVWLPSEEPWECLIFLDPLENVDVPVRWLNRALGYDTDATPRGFEILGERAQSIVARAGGPRPFLEGLIEAGEPAPQEELEVDLTAGNGANPMPPLETIPALRIGYAHRILLELLSREPISIAELFAQVDPESLLKSEREHRAPVDRAQQVLLFARRLGLVQQDGEKFALTAVGEEYVEAGDEDDIWSLSPRQAELLRTQLARLHLTEGVLFATALMLSIIATAHEDRTYSTEQLGRALGRAASRSGWRSPRTFLSQGSRFLMLLSDMELAADGQVTSLGRDVLEQLNVPEHPDLESLLAESDHDADGPNFWWVNQSATYDEEKRLGLIWAPKLTSNERRLAHWDSLLDVEPGDVIVHCAHGNIRAVSEALSGYVDAEQPQELATGSWSKEGRKVATEYRELADPIPVIRIPESVRTTAGRPFDRDGGVTQGYLFPLTDEMVDELARLFPELELRGASLRRAQPLVRQRRDLVAAEVERRARAEGLRLPASTCATLVAALRAGKHVILTGPPGTAKTSLARIVGEIATENALAEGYVLTTATADWTTYETIGGLRPTEHGLEFVEGHFLAAIEKQQWLVIDELNRSNFDRAFGQLFTVLSGQPVVLPYTRRMKSGPLTLVPHGATSPVVTDDELPVGEDWRVIATMNVFDKSLLFEMSYALMRRFAFIEVASPEPVVFREVIRAATPASPDAAAIADRLFGVLRLIKDVGPAVYIDVARYAEQRLADQSDSDAELVFEAFYSYLLPQFEGIDDDDGARLFRAVSPLLTASLRGRLRTTLNDVLGLRLTSRVRGRDEEGEDGEEDEMEVVVDELADAGDVDADVET